MNRVTEVERAARALQALMSEAAELQWLLAPVPRPPGDLDETKTDADARKATRTSPPDPTGDAATDPLRRTLREAVLAADSTAHRAAIALNDARTRLAEALSLWHGRQD